MIKSALLTIGIAALALSSVNATADGTVVTYQGDHAAKKVCMSITKDDLRTMKLALKRAASNSPIPYSRVHKYYTCNDLALIDFAYEWQATNTIGYLESRGERRGNVSMEEVASR